MGADIIVSFAESQRETKKIVAKKKQQSKKVGKNFFAFTFGFFYATIATTKRKKIGDEETGQF